jgi:hypothetical protein
MELIRVQSKLAFSLSSVLDRQVRKFFMNNKI